MFPLADVLFSTEGLVIISGMLLALTGAIGVMFKLLQDNYNARLADKDKQLVQQIQEANSWKQIGTSAVINLRKAANAKRLTEGRILLEDIADVVPEHNSLTTDEQQRAAYMASIRANLVASTLDLGLAARVEGIEIKDTFDTKDKAAVAAEITQQVATELKDAAVPPPEPPTKTTEDVSKYVDPDPRLNQ